MRRFSQIWSWCEPAAIRVWCAPRGFRVGRLWIHDPQKNRYRFLFCYCGKKETKVSCCWTSMTKRPDLNRTLTKLLPASPTLAVFQSELNLSISRVLWIKNRFICSLQLALFIICIDLFWIKFIAFILVWQVFSLGDLRHVKEFQGAIHYI